jgi:hypothetical protein
MQHIKATEQNKCIVAYQSNVAYQKQCSISKQCGNVAYQKQCSISKQCGNITYQSNAGEQKQCSISKFRFVGQKYERKIYKYHCGVWGG